MKIYLLLALVLLAVAFTAGAPKHYLVETADAPVDYQNMADGSNRDIIRHHNDYEDYWYAYTLYGF